MNNLRVSDCFVSKGGNRLTVTVDKTNLFDNRLTASGGKLKSAALVCLLWVQDTHVTAHIYQVTQLSPARLSLGPQDTFRRIPRKLR